MHTTETKSSLSLSILSMAKRTKTTPNENSTEDAILQAYADMVLEDVCPITVHQLAQRAGITEEEFYKHFSQVSAVPQRIYDKLGQTLQAKLEGSETYLNYSAREKILAYFFTLFELALAQRSFIQKTHCQHGVWQAYEQRFATLMNEVVQEGIASGELRDRLSLSQYYPKLLWPLHQQLVHFWLHDTSPEFADTEKAVEVYCKLPLELMGYNLIDTVAERLKFEWEQIQKTDFFKRIFN